MRKVFQKENILPAVALTFVSWLGVSVVSSKVALASLQTSQSETKRVNALVYEINESIPKINSQLNSIEDLVNENMELTKSLSKEQNSMNLKLFCNSVFADRSSESYTKCVTEIVKNNY